MAVSWDEFIISWFVSGLEVTLPVAIFNELQGQVSARINAIGTIVFGVTITLVVVAQLILFVWARTAAGGSGWRRGPDVSDKALVLENVVKRFGEVNAVAGISLEVDHGEFVAFIGQWLAGRRRRCG